MGPWVLLLAVDFGAQWIVWAVSSVFATEQFYDLTGSLTFLTLIYLSNKIGSGSSFRKNMVSGMAGIWALRLGSFLFLRVLKSGEDKRFHKVKHEPARFWIWWTLQGIWVFVTLLPTLVLNLKQIYKPVGWRDYVGWSIWFAGFAIEVIADHQKTSFRANPDNSGRFITSGLWSISRHPNYFGEIVMWCGLWLSSSSVMSGFELLTLLCPMFDALLLVKLSGIPILERMADQRWGAESAYQAYKASTSVLIPWLW